MTKLKYTIEIITILIFFIVPVLFIDKTNTKERPRDAFALKPQGEFFPFEPLFLYDRNVGLSYHIKKMSQDILDSSFFKPI